MGHLITLPELGSDFCVVPRGLQEAYGLPRPLFRRGEPPRRLASIPFPGECRPFATEARPYPLTEVKAEGRTRASAATVSLAFDSEAIVVSLIRAVARTYLRDSDYFLS